VARKENYFEGQNNNDTITAANSGGGSGDPFSSVGTSGTFTRVYDTSVAADGTHSAHLTADAASTIYLAYSGYADSAGAMRFKFYLNAIPSGTLFIARIMANADASRSAQCAINSSGQMLVADAAGSTKATFTGTTLSLQTWYRGELESIIGGSTSTGTINCRLYLDNAAEESPLASYASGATVNAGTTTVSGFRLGVVITGVAGDLNFDSYAIDNGTSNPIGPVPKAGTVVTASHPGAGPSNYGRFFLTPRDTTVTVIPDQTVAAAAIVDAETVGNPAVTPGTATVNPASVQPDGAVGNAAVTPGAATVSPASIPTTANVGFLSITTTYTVSPASIPAEERVGAPGVTPGAVTVSPASIVSDERFGNATVLLAQSVNVYSIPSTDRPGSPVVTPGSVSVTPHGISSGEQVGAAGLTNTYTVTAYSISSAERIGNVALSAVTVLNPASIGSDERVVSSTVTTTVTVAAYGINSGEQLGNPVVTVGAVAQTMAGYGIRSGEAVGAATVAALVSRDVGLSGLSVESGRITATVIRARLIPDLEEGR
jgi:hypothetical protein